MISVQQIIDIAAKYSTVIADATYLACIQRANKTGEPLVIPARKMQARRAKRTLLESDDVDWQRMVEKNSDTRQFHM